MVRDLDISANTSDINQNEIKTDVNAVKEQEIIDILKLVELNIVVGDFESATVFLNKIIEDETKYSKALWYRNPRVWFCKVLIKYKANYDSLSNDVISKIKQEPDYKKAMLFAKELDNVESDLPYRDFIEKFSSYNINTVKKIQNETNIEDEQDSVLVKEENPINVKVDCYFAIETTDDEKNKIAEAKEELVKLKEQYTSYNSVNDFEIKDGCLVKYNGHSNIVVIPNTVSSIGENVFDSEINCGDISTVVISDSVVEIKRDAFFRCRKLENVFIPKNVKIIDGAVFSYCDNLKNIYVDIENEKYQTLNGCLIEKNEKKLLCYPCGRVDEFYIIPKEIKLVATRAFGGCINLKNVNALEFNGVFENCAFMSCRSLKEIVLPNSLTELPYGMFLSCDNLEKVVISEKATKISDRCFRFCKKLKEINLPESITYIGERAFGGNFALNTITLSSGMDFIGERAFAGWKENQSIFIALSKIQTKYWHNLWTTDCSACIKYNVESKANKTLDKVTVSQKDMQLANNWLIKYTGNDRHIVIPNNITRICSEAFSECENLISVSFLSESNLETVCSSAFCSCSQLNSITLPKHVKQIEGSFISECPCVEILNIDMENKNYYSEDNCIIDRKTKILLQGSANGKIPNGVKEIGKWAFYGFEWEDGKEIVIPQTVAAIGEGAFITAGFNCLSKITIPNSIISIEEDCFEEETVINFKGTKEQWEEANANNYTNYDDFIIHCIDGDY